MYERQVTSNMIATKSNAHDSTLAPHCQDATGDLNSVLGAKIVIIECHIPIRRPSLPRTKTCGATSSGECTTCFVKYLLDAALLQETIAQMRVRKTRLRHGLGNTSGPGVSCRKATRTNLSMINERAIDHRIGFRSLTWRNALILLGQIEE